MLPVSRRHARTLAGALLCAGLPLATTPAHAQTVASAATRLSASDVQQLAKVQVALLSLQDSLNAVMAQPRNKTGEAQGRLQGDLRTQVEAIIKTAGLTPDEFQRRRFQVSTDNTLRQAFDSITGAMLGVPIKTAEASTAATTAATAKTMAADGAPAQPEMPAGPVGTHLGHVLVSFMNTPDKASLLSVAQAEATVAAQHAALAAKAPTNLQAMQTHAGHVLHAIDPALVAAGPGPGYGLKKAANGVAAHIELAAKAEGASAGLKTHAEHVATAARSTVARADEIVALAERIRSASDAAAAAALMGQLVSLTEQLTVGADVNADGQVGWGGGEGGLRQAETHAKLALGAAGK